MHFSQNDSSPPKACCLLNYDYVSCAANCARSDHLALLNSAFFVSPSFREKGCKTRNVLWTKVAFEGINDRFEKQFNQLNYIHSLLYSLSLIVWSQISHCLLARTAVVIPTFSSFAITTVFSFGCIFLLFFCLLFPILSFDLVFELCENKKKHVCVVCIQDAIVSFKKRSEVRLKFVIIKKENVSQKRKQNNQVSFGPRIASYY